MRKEQTKLHSFIEQVVIRLAGFVVAIVTGELFVYKMFGISVSASQNFSLLSYFTMQSIFVGYFIRRFFEARIKRK